MYSYYAKPNGALKLCTLVIQLVSKASVQGILSPAPCTETKSEHLFSRVAIQVEYQTAASKEILKAFPMQFAILVTIAPKLIQCVIARNVGSTLVAQFAD